jgi:protein-tyrosine phosphatase
MIGRLLVVCTGNVCRSPVVASLIAARLPGVSVSSAGIAAKEDVPVDPVAAAALEARTGMDIGRHRPRRLVSALCDEADVVLVMERAHRQLLLARFCSSWGKTLMFDSGEDVFDPRGQPRHVYDAWLGHILEKVEVWVDRIAKVNGAG